MSLAGRRIAIVQGSFSWGGSEAQGLLLARGLRDRHGALVAYAGMGEAGEAARRCAEHAIPCIALPRVESRFPPLARWRLRAAAAAVDAWRPDAVVPFGSAANAVAARATPGRSIWNQRDAGIARLPHAIERSALARAGLVIANSPAGAAWLRDAHGVAPDRVRVIANGVALAAPRADVAQWRRRLGEPGFCAAMIANLHPPKDPATALRAWRRVVAAGGDRAVLAFAGRDDGLGAGLTELARDLGLQDSVAWLGHVDDVSGLLAAVDLVIHSSASEGSPNAVIEAMAAGRAVIASDLPAVRHALGDAAPAWTFPAGDDAALAALIDRVRRDAAASRDAGSANAARARERWSAEAMIDAWASAILETSGC